MYQQSSDSGAWGVLLAGDDGTRLRSLTAMVEGDARPKQFCRLLDNDSLLTQTRRRIDPLFSAERVLAVVTKRHAKFYERQLSDLPRAGFLVQPEDRGTGIAVARTILMIVLELDPDAVVAFFPCDHYYKDETAFLKTVEAGIRAAESNRDKIVVLGAQPTYPETDYGWIQPVQLAPAGSEIAPSRVHRFWEKPDLATAQELLRGGCLWNTFVTIGRASTFIEILCAAIPEVILTLTAGIKQGDINASYPLIPVVDFSREVLAPQPERLLVIQDATSGWTDLGSPDRVFEVVVGQAVVPTWLQSVRNVDRLAAS